MQALAPPTCPINFGSRGVDRATAFGVSAPITPKSLTAVASSKARPSFLVTISKSLRQLEVACMAHCAASRSRSARITRVGTSTSVSSGEQRQRRSMR